MGTSSWLWSRMERGALANARDL